MCNTRSPGEVPWQWELWLSSLEHDLGLKFDCWLCHLCAFEQLLKFSEPWFLYP